MALAHCKTHGEPGGQTRRYVRAAEPVGGPDTVVYCGIGQCVRPALIWLDEDEARDYAAGQRIFALVSHQAKIRVE